MNRMWRLWAALAIGAVVAIGIGVAFALRGDGDTPVSDTPDPGPGQSTAPDSALDAARLDVARRTGVDARHVQLVRIQPAGFDGCLGVYKPDTACTEILVGGYIAWFEASGTPYRYHFGGAQWIATDFVPDGTRIDDGTPIDASFAPDFVALLTEYARSDAARLRNDPEQNTAIEAVTPFVCPENARCVKEAFTSALADVRLPSGAMHYVVQSSFDDPATTPIVELDDMTNWGGAKTADMRAFQQHLREDLAQRLSLSVNDVSVLSMRIGTWPNGCLGVQQPGKVCSQALVDGWQAKLVADGREYRYHGGGLPLPGGEFIAASFIANATLDELPRE